MSDSLQPTDYTVHGILQARILEWVAFSFFRGSSQLRDQTQVSCIAGGFLTSWATRMFIGRTDVEAETPILWPPDAKSWLIWKDPDAGKDWGQEEKGTTEDETVGWHHRLNGYGFGGTPGVGDGQGGLACCGSWGHKESDVSEQLKWTELNQGIPNLSEKCLWILLGTVIDSPSKTSAENISGKEQGKLCNLQTSISLSFTLFSRDKEGELAFW